MRIELHFDLDEDGQIVGRHFIDTDDPVVMTMLRALSNGTLKIEGTGWDLPTSHPLYPGENRLHAVTEEMRKAGINL